MIATRAEPRYTLGPERVALIGDVPLRLNEDLRKCVAFVGYVVMDDDGSRKFVPGGTGFFVIHERACYFVTARHVAAALEPPFAMRATNDKDEPVLLDEIESAGWFFHPDENVDLAIVSGIPKGVRPLDSGAILTRKKLTEMSIGIGDETHIVGLYRLLHGKKKNIPIVHTGHIAMVPEDERIPQRDRTFNRLIHVEGYLVEAQTLEGLSGSPVFVTASRSAYFDGTIAGQPKKQYALLSAEGYFLGVWSGAWDAPPGEVLSLERPDAKRVPVGMGITVPGYRLLELLDMPEVVEHRKRRLAEEDGAASADHDLSRPLAEPPTTDANPQHKEDFTRLLNAAVKAPQRGKKT